MEYNTQRRNNFIGHDQFIWWIGVVENRQDPLKCGRLQVRIKGLHHDNKSILPTEELPWTQPLFPINNSFATPTTLKEGDMVVGFFMDGDAAQFPIVFGCFHGIPEDKADPNKGFSDPRDKELSDSPRGPKSLKFNTDGSGVSIEENTKSSSNPKLLNEPTIDRVARNESVDSDIIGNDHTEVGVIKSKKESRIKNVSTATGGSWQEPETQYSAQHPYNKVIHTESGHYLEFDDTPSKERVHLYHRSGNFIEMFPNGDRVEKITKDNYSIVMKDDHVYIMGKCDVTIQQNATLYVKGTLDIKVGGECNITCGGNFNVKAPNINLN